MKAHTDGSMSGWSGQQSLARPTASMELNRAGEYGKASFDRKLGKGFLVVKP
jgi:hypothetical protein